MLWLVKVFFVAGALLALLSAWAFADGIRFLGFVGRKLNGRPITYAPVAAVIIPCKGADPGFDANVDAFLSQHYPDYQVVFVVATVTEVAYQKLYARLQAANAPGAARNPRTTLAVAGIADGRGEKVNNLLHGIDALDHAAAVLVFADVDATPSPDWLSSLVAPLASDQITVSTGFRWYLPGRGFVSQVRAAWDTSIATMMGDHDHNFAWGGSMAIRAADFCRLRIADEYWANTVSDDYSLTRAVREAKGKIAFEPLCLMASREESSVGEFLRWSTRQIIITRVYAAHLWMLGLANYLFYCGTMMSGLLLLVVTGVKAHQRATIAIILFVIVLLGGAKGFIRSIVARKLFAEKIYRSVSCYWLMSPLVPWVMLINFVAAGFTRRIEWRGTEYELVSRDKVRIRSHTLG